MSQNAPATLSPAMRGQMPKVHEWPLTYVIAGLVVLLFGMFGWSIQLTTSELWFSGAPGSVSLAPHFGIFGQLLDIWNGNLSGMGLEGAAWSYGVQAIVVACSIGLEFPKNHKGWDIFFAGLIVVALILDSVSDFAYNAGGGVLQQIGFTVIILAMSFGPGKFGIHYIVKGIRGFLRK